jgi:hypothetical protein
VTLWTPTSIQEAASSGTRTRIGLAGLVRWSFKMAENQVLRPRTRRLPMSLGGTRLVEIATVFAEGEL